jgi:hypothetical protein
MFARHLHQGGVTGITAHVSRAGGAVLLCLSSAKGLGASYSLTRGDSLRGELPGFDYGAALAGSGIKVAQRTSDIEPATLDLNPTSMVSRLDIHKGKTYLTQRWSGQGSTRLDDNTIRFCNGHLDDEVRAGYVKRLT